MKSIKIYFILYIIILVEAFAIIVERDDAQDALFNNLFKERHSISFLIQEQEFKTYFGDRLRAQKALFTNYLIPDKLISKKEFMNASLSFTVKDISNSSYNNLEGKTLVLEPGVDSAQIGDGNNFIIKVIKDTLGFYKMQTYFHAECKVSVEVDITTIGAFPDYYSPEFISHIPQQKKDDLNIGKVLHCESVYKFSIISKSTGIIPH